MGRVDVAITELDGEDGIFERDGERHRVSFDTEQIAALRDCLRRPHDEGIHMNVDEDDIKPI
jgi:hypothetical protein